MRRRLFAWSRQDRKSEPVGDLQQTWPIDAIFSPDGRWIAYRSSQAGRSAVSVQPFPTTGQPFLISEGIHPVWSADRRTLIFRRLTTGELQASAVTLTPAFSFSPAHEFPAGFQDRVQNSGRRNYDVLPDGKRLIGVIPAADAQLQPTQIQVVLNWVEELRQRVPAVR